MIQSYLMGRFLICQKLKINKVLKCDFHYFTQICKQRFNRMRGILQLFLLLSTCWMHVYAQKISGQWRGNFNELSNDEATEYVLEIEVNGEKLEGTSITYFTLRGKKYYTMCAVTGSYDPNAKTIIAKEISKIKANTPEWFRDCFQTHTLTYFKKGHEEQLSGTWKSSKKEDNCGRGTTLLSRKILVKTPSAQPVAKQQQKPTPKKEDEKQNPSGSAENKIAILKNEKSERPVNTEIPPKANALTQLEKRNNKVFDTIYIQDNHIAISLFDNGEIDGDIITVIFNNEIILSKQTLSEKPIQIQLTPEKGKENLLIMYAENQGKVPPNTAIMRAQSGNNYYKIFLSADDKENAGVILKFKE